MKSMPPTSETLAAHLRAAVRGAVRFDHFSRVLYSTDASIYQILPIGVVLPRDTDDVAATLRLCADAGVPVLPRGVVQDDLNAAAARFGLRLGPDTATSNRATLGGMIGNNSCGARSIVYGKMVDHVERMGILGVGGEEMTLDPLDDAELAAKVREPSREGRLYRTVLETVQAQRDEIDRRYPKILRRVAGYNLPELFLRPFNLARLIVGSEGTLALATEATVRLVPRPPHTATALLPHRPSAVELLDRFVLEMTRAQLEYARRMTFVQGDPDALLVVEFAAEHHGEVLDRLGGPGG